MKKINLTLTAFICLISGTVALAGSNYVYQRAGGNQYSINKLNELSTSVNIEGSLDAGSITNWQIINQQGEISIVASPDEQIHYKITGYNISAEQPQINIDQIKSAASININRDQKWFDLDYPFLTMLNKQKNPIDLKVELALPVGTQLNNLELATISEPIINTTNIQANNIQAYSVNGSILLNSLTNCQTAKVYNTSGKISIDQSNCLEYDLKSVSGNIALKQLNNSDKINIDIISGNILLNDSLTNSFKSQTVSGDFTADNCQIALAESDSVSGNLNLSNSLIGQLDYNSISGDLNLKNNVFSKNTIFDTVSGTIHNQ